MIYFSNDYQEGCAPQILERLAATNLKQTDGYGLDPYCDNARQLILNACHLSRTDTDNRHWRDRETAGIVHFLVGGTQVNSIVINSILRPHQGVICSDTGHIYVHETGAIEHSGHRVVYLPSADGKLTAAQIQDTLLAHLYDPNIEHTVQPAMVYLSFPTENGLLYSKNELQAISTVCHQYHIPLYIDGARLGYGLMSPCSDLTLPEIAALADIFYIGGTKQGALFGEALVISNPDLRKDFRYLIKQSGGLLAKGRLLGLQFSTLFEDLDKPLYMELSRHAITQAMRINQTLKTTSHKGIKLAWDSPTNQQFAIIHDDILHSLKQQFVFSTISKQPQDSKLVRICTSWGTKEDDVSRLIDKLS